MIYYFLFCRLILRVCVCVGFFLIYFRPQKMALPYYARWAQTLITMLKLLYDVRIMVLGFAALSVQ